MQSHSNGNRGHNDKRSEVELVLDSRDNAFDSAAWYLHKLHQNKHGYGHGHGYGRSESGCGCGGGGCARCWTPATAWFDYSKAYASYWRDIFDSLYGRSGCGPSYRGPSYCEPDCPPTDSTGKVRVTVKPGGTASETFVVCNPTCDPVALELSVDGFKTGIDAECRPEHDRKVVAAGDKRTIEVLVKCSKSLAPGRYEGLIVVKTPFAKRLLLEVTVSAGS